MHRLSLLQLAIIAAAGTQPALALRLQSKPPTSRASIESRFCASHPSPEAKRAASARFAVDRELQTYQRRAPADCTSLTNINLHWHVIQANETYEGGFLTDTQLGAQMDFLNSEWAKFAPIKFTLVNTTRTTDEEGFLYAREKKSDIKDRLWNTLHTGGEQDLNVYSVSFSIVPDLRGFSSFPDEYKATPVQDGLFIKWNSLPGGSLKSNGGSLVHEVGHWLGLYHTWQNGCDEANDEVDDTPAEDPVNAGRDTHSCPASFDSCPNMPGQDPIHNYMTYASDDCRTELTPGQIERVRTQISTYRGINLCSGSSTTTTPATTSGGTSTSSSGNTNGTTAGSSGTSSSGTTGSTGNGSAGSSGDSTGGSVGTDNSNNNGSGTSTAPTDPTKEPTSSASFVRASLWTSLGACMAMLLQ